MVYTLCSLAASMLQFTGEDRCSCVLYPPKMAWKKLLSKGTLKSRVESCVFTMCVPRRTLSGRRDKKKLLSRGAGFLLCSTLAIPASTFIIFILCNNRMTVSLTFPAG